LLVRRSQLEERQKEQAEPFNRFEVTYSPRQTGRQYQMSAYAALAQLVVQCLGKTKVVDSNSTRGSIMEDFNKCWEWCALCECAFIRCPKCGNNGCNAGSGAFDANGKRTYAGASDAVVKCDVCDRAHEFQMGAYECNRVPAREGLKGGSDEEIKKYLDEMDNFWSVGLDGDIK
jgi:hypothetical protein